MEEVEKRQLRCGGAGECCKFHWRGKVSVILLVLLLPILIYGTEHNSAEAKTLFVLLLMTSFWITECIPLYITSLFPAILFPLFGILSSSEVCNLYFTDTLVMFLGGLFISVAIEYCNINKRIAFASILFVGCRIRRLHFTLTFVCSIISMFICNMSCVSMMCPIVKAILNEMETHEIFEVYMPESNDPTKKTPHLSMLGMSFYFGIAYATMIGGSATLIGTSTNMSFKLLYEGDFPNIKEKLTFARFIYYTFPIAYLLNVIGVILTIQVTHMGLFRPNSYIGRQVRTANESKDIIRRQIQQHYKELGPWTCHEIQVLILFIAMLLLLVFAQPGFTPGWFHVNEKTNLSYSVPIMLTVILLFALPTRYTFFRYFYGKRMLILTIAKESFPAHTCLSTLPAIAPYPARCMDACLSWTYVKKRMSWGLMFLLGGGFALGEGSKVSGLAKWLGDGLKTIDVMPDYALVAVFIIISLICTTFTSNIAICNILIPIYGELAIALKMHPLQLMFPAALSFSMAYILPISTPTNAIVCAFASIKSKYLALAGILPTLWSFSLLWLNAFSWSNIVFPNIKDGMNSIE